MRIRLIRQDGLREPQGQPLGGGGASGEGALPRVRQGLQHRVPPTPSHGQRASGQREEVPQVPLMRLGLPKFGCQDTPRGEGPQGLGIPV